MRSFPELASSGIVSALYLKTPSSAPYGTEGLEFVTMQLATFLFSFLPTCHKGRFLSAHTR